MADPLSIAGTVVGLIGTSANVLAILYGLYQKAKDAPESIRRVISEIEEMNTIFTQVRVFISGAARADHDRLTMISVHHLTTTLSGCVLVCDSLHRYIGEVAGLADPGVTGNTNKVKVVWGRVKWAAWKELDVAGFIDELQRHKQSLTLMLAIVQCNSAAEANTSLAQLHAAVAEILDSQHKMDMKLGEFIARRSPADAAWDTASAAEGGTAPASPQLSVSNSPDIAGVNPTSTDMCDLNARDSAEASTSTSLSHSSTTTGYWSSRKRDSDDAGSIMSASSSVSRRSVRSVIPSFHEVLKNARPYKLLSRRGGLDDSQSIAGFSLASSQKGCNWSMLSDMSLGDLSISDIAVMKLPIYVSDLYDPGPYLLADIEARQTSAKDLKSKWSTRGRIHNAITSGNLFVVRALLSIGSDIEERSVKGQTPLLHAVHREHEDIVKLLLEKGATCEARDDEGRTPLALAAVRNRKAVLRLLLEKGVDLEAKDIKGQTPLALAALHSGVVIVRFLLEEGADLETRDENGRTPLAHAVLQNNEDIVLFLLEKGANTDVLREIGSTLEFQGRLHDAAKAGNVNVLRLLLVVGSYLEERNAQGLTPLALAALQKGAGRCAILQLLLEKGADLETRDENGRTPLAHAVLRNNGSSFSFLFQRRANLETCDVQGRTTLTGAVRQNMYNVEIVRFLLEKGADLETRDAEGRTPLTHAVRQNMYNVEIVRFLLKKGADLETRDAEGRTPLAHVVLQNNERMVRFLLEKGANTDVLREIGSTLDFQGRLHDAANAGNENVLRLLLVMRPHSEKLNAQGLTPRALAVLQNGEAIVQFVLEKGANIDVLREIGSTIDLQGRLQDAVKAGNEIDLRLFIAMGSDLDERDAQGLTPLALAVLENHELFVKVLLEKGANIDVLSDIGWQRDLQGRIGDAIKAGNAEVVRLLLVMGVDIEESLMGRKQTPLMRACIDCQSEIVRLLVAQGADVKACDRYGYTVLHYAVMGVTAQERESLLTFLLDIGTVELINAINDYGDTPLHRAAASDERTGLARVLFEKGARLDIKNRDGLTPYKYAHAMGSSDIAGGIWSKLEPNEQAQLERSRFAHFARLQVKMRGITEPI